MNTEKEPFDPLDEPPHKIDYKSCSIKLDPYSEPNTINLFTYPKPKWSIEFAPDCFIYTPRKYNWFHRLMQRLILGFKWKRMEKKSGQSTPEIASDSDEQRDLTALLRLLREVRRERDEARDLLSTCMSVMPIGNIKTHTLKNLPTRIGDLASAIAAETEENERLERELYEAQRIIDQYKEMFDMQTKLVVDLEMRLIKMEEKLK